MGKCKKIEVGDKFMLNCGIEVTVLEFIKASRVCVQTICGQKIYCSSDALRKGHVSVFVNGKRKTGHSNKNVPPVKIEVGCQIDSNCWGKVTVMEVLPKSRYSVRFNNTGYVSNVSRTSLLSGEIRDRTAFVLNVTKKFSIGG